MSALSGAASKPAAKVGCNDVTNSSSVMAELILWTLLGVEQGLLTRLEVSKVGVEGAVEQMDSREVDPQPVLGTAGEQLLGDGDGVVVGEKDRRGDPPHAHSASTRSACSCSE